MNSQLVGFVGVGRMGGHMASRLLDAGFTLSVFDTNAEVTGPLAARGAAVETSAQAVASKARIVLMSLPTPQIVQSVALGSIANGTAVKIVCDLSTSGPGVANVISKGLAEKGVVTFDTPVSGGMKGAKEGTLAVMVSGPKASYAEIEPILKNFGKLFFTGEKPGLAQTAKLANNLLAAAALVVSSEAMAMGVKAGLDPKILLDIINAGSGRNSATQDKFPRSVLPGTFDFGFATGLSYKDVRLCVDEAEALGVPMVVGAAVRQMLAVTQAKFGAQSDFTCIAKVLEEWAGVEIRSKTT
jgi:3-hydroxyisobutyrate dehydrogenase-like beta-hydroxyacid dehydrogenase